MQEFDDLVRGWFLRRQLEDDRFGYLRRDLLIAQGVTFGGAGHGPKPGTPTFELVMGRPPVDLAIFEYFRVDLPISPDDPYCQRVEAHWSEFDVLSAEDRIRRSEEMLAAL